MSQSHTFKSTRNDLNSEYSSKEAAVNEGEDDETSFGVFEGLQEE